MSNFYDKYKKKPGSFNDPATGRMMRAGQQEERRKHNRADNYLRYRDVVASPAKPAIKASLDPEIRLRKWKLERALKKKMEQQKKKPVFKVGVVHHHFYSPTVNDRINNKSIPCHTRGARKVKAQPTPPKRITRATQKRLEAKKVAVTSTVSSVSGTSISRTKTEKKPIGPAKKTSDASFAPENYVFKAPVGIQTLTMFGRFAIDGESLLQNDLVKEIQHCVESPWPTSSGVPNKLTSPREMCKPPLVRQKPVDCTSISGSETNSSPMKNDLTTRRESKISQPDDRLESPKVQHNDFPNISKSDLRNSPIPAMFSPYITTSRGKDSARRERRSKMGIGCSPLGEIPTKETVIQNLNISIEDEERTAQYFKFLFQREINRLNELCAKWEKIKNDPELSEDARYLINQAVGQTNLLIKKKFERFRGLVQDCETGKGEMLVQCRDLQGFWDVVYIEVQNCDSRFRELERLRENNWIEEETVLKTNKPMAKKKVAATKFAINAKSSARSWILAKKKKMSQLEGPNEDVILVGSNSENAQPSMSGTTETTPRDKIITRRNMKKSPQSIPQIAKRANLKPTPKKTPASLLKKVQLSETVKKVNSPLAIMKISKMCKTPEVRLDDSISYVNSDQTPSKGILKKSEEISNESVLPKSSRKVDFIDDVSNETRNNEDLENSIDLGRALARIETYDSDDCDDVFDPIDPADTKVTVRQRINFEDESFTEAVDRDIEEDNISEQTKENFDVPIINVIEATPSARLTANGSILSQGIKATKRANNINEATREEQQPEEDGSIRRVLRNRKVPISTPSKNTQSRTKLSLKKKTAMLDSSTKENDDPRVEAKKFNELEVSKSNGTDTGNDETIKRRKSTRKSVRFNADDCPGCSDSHKPVHPMTPHSRKNRKVSLLGDDHRQSIGPLSNGDLISFDSPSTTMVPPRVRRGSEVSKKFANQ